MEVAIRNRWALSGMLVALLCSVPVAQETNPAATMNLESIVRLMQNAQAASHPQVSYQIIREYRLSGAKDAKADSEVVAEVNFQPPASKGYVIQKSSGSNRGQQLVRRILDNEVAATSKDKKANNAISNDNYAFSYVGEASLGGHSCYVLGLKPKRSEKDLIAGQIWVDKRSFRVRQVEGEVEKTPSWWLKRVRVKLGFAELEGLWVQTSMEAVADVRLVGEHTLTSRILDYRREAEVAVTPISRGSTLGK